MLSQFKRLPAVDKIRCMWYVCLGFITAPPLMYAAYILGDVAVHSFQDGFTWEAVTLSVVLVGTGILLALSALLPFKVAHAILKNDGWVNHY